MRYFLLSGCLFMILLACKEERIPFPKPRMYPKVTYPERNYVAFDKNYCAFSFQYPTYMKFERDSLLGNQQSKHPCWFTMEMPDLNGSVHFTYTDISGDSLAEKLFDILNDSYQLSTKHNIKAAGRTITETKDLERRLYAQIYGVEGDVASPYHFVLTDSMQHAIWASLYFKTRPEADSMAPIVDFVKEDLGKVIETFEWNN